jgi:hypothetical protein
VLTGGKGMPEAEVRAMFADAKAERPDAAAREGVGRKSRPPRS